MPCLFYLGLFQVHSELECIHLTFCIILRNHLVRTATTQFKEMGVKGG